jgi:hypothetical protein
MANHILVVDARTWHSHIVSTALRYRAHSPNPLPTVKPLLSRIQPLMIRQTARSVNNPAYYDVDRATVRGKANPEAIIHMTPGKIC